MKMLINRQAVKRFALDASKNRHHRFTRVSEDFYDKTEGFLRRFIRDHVSRLPSKGRTI